MLVHMYVTMTKYSICTLTVNVQKMDLINTFQAFVSHQPKLNGVVISVQTL